MKKKPPVKTNEVEKVFVNTLKERDRRHFIACKAAGPEGGSARAVCEFFKCSPNTISRGNKELCNNIVPPNDRQRMPGGGAKDKIEKHPKWTAAFIEIVSDHMAGDPMGRTVRDKYKECVARRIGFDDSCHNWNFLGSPT